LRVEGGWFFRREIMGGPVQKLFQLANDTRGNGRDGRDQNHSSGVFNHCTTGSCSNHRGKIASGVSQATGTTQYTITPGAQQAAIRNIITSTGAASSNSPLGKFPNNTLSNNVTSGQTLVEIQPGVKAKIIDGQIYAVVDINNNGLKDSKLSLSYKGDSSFDYRRTNTDFNLKTLISGNIAGIDLQKDKQNGTLSVKAPKDIDQVVLNFKEANGNTTSITISKADLLARANQPVVAQPPLNQAQPNQPQPQPQPIMTPPTPSAGPSTGPTSRDRIIADDAKKLVDAIKIEQTPFGLASKWGGHGTNGLPVAIKQLANREEANRILNSYDSLHLRGELIRAGGDNLVNLVKNSPLQDTLLDMLLQTKDKSRDDIANHVKEFSKSQSSGVFPSNKERLAAISDLLMTTPGLATAMGLEWETNYRGSFRKTESLLGQLNWELGITGEKDLGKFETSAIKAWERRVLSGK